MFSFIPGKLGPRTEISVEISFKLKQDPGQGHALQVSAMRWGIGL